MNIIEWSHMSGAYYSKNIYTYITLNQEIQDKDLFMDEGHFY